MTGRTAPRLCAILLAGGRAARMGGIDKPGLPVGGVSMRRRAIDAVTAVGASPVVVVGPPPETSSTSHTALPQAVRWAREDPPFSGPASAVAAGLTALGSDGAEWTVLLACDLPRPDAVVARLVQGIRGLAPETLGACLVGEDGRMQWLTGVYRTAALREAADALPGRGRDLPVRALLSGLPVVALADPDAAATDVDTWEDYEQWTKEHR